MRYLHAIAVPVLLILPFLNALRDTGLPQDDFDTRWDNCTQLAIHADNGLQSADVPQMIEDCMDSL